MESVYPESLGHAVVKFLAKSTSGAPLSPPENTSGDVMGQTLTIWLCDISRTPLNTEFEQQLSPQQLAIHRVLLEWTSGWIDGEDEVFNTAAQEARDNVKEALYGVHNFQSYHNAMAKLFVYEFFRHPRFDHGGFLHMLNIFRQLALEYATCHRISRRYLGSIATSQQNSIQNDPLVAQI